MKNSPHLLKTRSKAVGVELALGDRYRDHRDLWRHLDQCK